MSSNMIPGVPNLRSLLPRLPNMGIANQALSQEEELSRLSESERLFLSGAPEVDVERARQYENLYGPTGLRPIAEGLDVEPPADKRGLLETFTDYATRLQSATTGFVTGLAGMERRRETFGTGGAVSGELFDRPESAQGGLGLALERFAQGLSGEEKFQAADFGALAYDRETAGTGERFLKSAAGFVLDVALDPLTYVSFGGSILGRRLGAQAVNRVARKNASNLIGTMDDAGKAAVTKNAVLRLGTDDAVLTNTVRQLRPDLAPPTGLMKTDDALSALGQIPGALDDIAMDSMAATSAAMYRSFGPGGLFRYLSDEFGPAGVQFWRQLPNDIKGGIRFRVPFSGLYRRATGQAGELGGALPVALRVPGTGTGKIAKALRVDGLNDKARSWFRSKRLLRGGADNLQGYTGASNMATAEAIFKRESDRVKGVLGEFDPQVDGKLRAVSWKSTDELEEQVKLLRAGAMTAMSDLITPMQLGTKAYRAGRAIDADEFDATFDQLLKVDINSFTGSDRTIENVLGLTGKATELQQEAFAAADNFQMILRRIQSEMQDLENSYAGFSPNFIENYWPRIMDDMQRQLSGTRVGSSFGNLKQRTHFAAKIGPNGEIERWMTPGEIKAQTGMDIFSQDAEKVITAYATSMMKFLQEERFFQNLLDRGVLFRGGAEALGPIKTDLTAASLAWKDGYDTLLAGRQALRQMGRGRYEDRLSGEGLTGNELQAVVQEAERVARALQSARIHGRRVLEQYRHVGENLWRSPDGTTIRGTTAAGTTVYQIERTRNGVRQFLTEGGQWSKSDAKADLFFTPDEAKARADRALVTQRSRQFVDQVEEVREEFLRDTARAIRNRGVMARNGLNPLEPGNIPLARQDEYFAQISEVIDKYGSDAGLQSRRLMADAYRSEGFGAGAGAAFRPAALGADDGPQVRAFWQGRMERLGIFGAETLVDDVRRIFAAADRPSKAKKWVQDWYVPFYAAQKALMTAQRGPGYVLRNIQGGMWNAYLVGTTARHWRLAGAVKTAEMQADSIGRKAFPDDRMKAAEVSLREFRRILDDKLGARRGAKMFDAWLSFEKRGLRGRNLTSQTSGINETVGLSTPTGTIRRALDADEMNVAQRVSQKVTNEWWWARRMSSAAQGSEDYLRFGAFLRGIDLYGLDDGGRAAALMVKATQFDYADLSAIEADVIKMLVPFYTWTRNNVTLQFRAMVAEPGKIMRAIRINDALADAFGEEEDPGEPMPAYVRERFGWKVREDLWTGPMGDAISGGMVIGEPLVDVNRLFSTQTGTGPVAGPASMLNWRELANQVNPIFGVGAEWFTGVERTTGGRLPQEEEAPPWLDILPGVGRDTGDGTVVSARGLRAARELLPPIGMIERYAAPLIGNERMQRRWYTTLASAVFGLPVSTLDPYQTGAELRAQEQRLRSGLERELGGDLARYTSYVRRALREQATPDEMQVIIKDGLLGGRNITDVPVEELDETAMVDTLRFMRRVRDLQARGVPRESLELMMDAFTPRTDAEQGVRSGKTPPLTPEQLATLGETPTSVASMSPEQRLELLQRWIRDNPDWGTALP